MRFPSFNQNKLFSFKLKRRWWLKKKVNYVNKHFLHEEISVWVELHPYLLPSSSTVSRWSWLASCTAKPQDKLGGNQQDNNFVLDYSSLWASWPSSAAVWLAIHLSYGLPLWSRTVLSLVQRNWHQSNASIQPGCLLNLPQSIGLF